MQHKPPQGFTILEMSIVLIIIGVIVGSIILGQSMLVTSRLQTVITDIDSITTAVGNFKQAYNALPGDFPNAIAIWGTDSVGCPTGGGTSGTCNGNGDGQILSTNAASQASENSLFWQHLYYAGMYGKSLSNQAGSGSAYDSIIGTNVPAGPFRGSGYSVTWWGTVAAGDANRYSGFYGNIIQFGKQDSGNITDIPVLTPEQTSEIDAKIDDGFPQTGKVRAYVYNSTNDVWCTTTASPAKYFLSMTTTVCSPIFVMGF